MAGPVGNLHAAVLDEAGAQVGVVDFDEDAEVVAHVLAQFADGVQGLEAAEIVTEYRRLRLEINAGDCVDAGGRVGTVDGVNGIEVAAARSVS